MKYKLLNTYIKMGNKWMLKFCIKFGMKKGPGKYAAKYQQPIHDINALKGSKRLTLNVGATCELPCGVKRTPQSNILFP